VALGAVIVALAGVDVGVACAQAVVVAPTVQRKSVKRKARPRNTGRIPMRHNWTSPSTGAALTADLSALMPGPVNGHWGAMVVSLTRGDTLFTHDAGTQVLPASTMKLFTSALALERLGPAHRFNTEVLRDGGVGTDGALRGNLILRGDGDPSLSPRLLGGLAADPMAMLIATACQQAVHFIGMPEGFYPLAECALYLALAPKSNSTGDAYAAALRDVQNTRNDPVPLHLRNAVTGLMRQMGYGSGYKNAHDFDGGVVEQQHLPDRVAGHTYYRPKDLGWEGRRKRERDGGGEVTP